MIYVINNSLCSNELLSTYITGLGKSEAHVLAAGWSIVTDDNSLCAQFEHTVAVFSDKTEVLTFSAEKVAATGSMPPYY